VIKPLETFQSLIDSLKSYWEAQGCLILQPFDMEVGAATFHPGTFLRSIGPEPWHTAYVQPSRRPTDGRYGKNPNRGQHFFQFQVMLKPSPNDIQMLYINSLEQLGVDPLSHDIRFVEGDWEAPTLGAHGLGWEVWLNGMEISQFTYFQQVGGLSCSPITGELSYGLERLAMFLQGVDDLNDICWAQSANGRITYGDIYRQNEREMSVYNFEMASVSDYLCQFEQLEAMCYQLIEKKLPIPAYELVVKISHMFNVLDARHAISVTERQRFILRVRRLSQGVAEAYLNVRESMGFPLLKNIGTK